eukprot:1142471-Pelagomonas_calceolata.AAC.6
MSDKHQRFLMVQTMSDEYSKKGRASDDEQGKASKPHGLDQKIPCCLVWPSQTASCVSIGSRKVEMKQHH